MARKRVEAQQVVENDLYEELQEEVETEEFEEENGELFPKLEVHATAINAQADLLAQAESLAAEFNEELTFNFATLEQFQALSEQVARFGAEIERMKELLVKNLEATAQLNRSLKRIESEPVVTLQVPNAPMSFEPKFAHPEPKLENVTQPETLKKEASNPINQRQSVALLQQQRKQLLRRPSATR